MNNNRSKKIQSKVCLDNICHTFIDRNGKTLIIIGSVLLGIGLYRNYNN